MKPGWILLAALFPLGCLTPPPASAPPSPVALAPETVAVLKDLSAWDAVPLMTPGVNIGNTLDNTTTWETGWGNPRITREFIQSLARDGFRSVRVPVAWDTYARAGQIDQDKLQRVEEVVDWVMAAGMFAVINIHWDGGWIDSGDKGKFPKTHATFSSEAQKKFPEYWRQISTYFAGKNEQLLFEALNEETHFENEGSKADAYATLTRVNQLFIDTVRKTGGNNGSRLLIVTGYHTDIAKTCAKEYRLPEDSVAGKLLLSVHYYTPYQFCGLLEDADWGKMMPTWGNAQHYRELDTLFGKLQAFSTENNIPIYLGEYGVAKEKDSASRMRWLSAVTSAAVSQKMVPVFWDTGNDISRHHPYDVSKEVKAMLKVAAPPAKPTAAQP